MEALLQCDQLVKTYNPGKPDAFTALTGATLEIGAGEVVAFTGPSGSGKTTLLSLLGCMSRPTEGRVTVSGREVSRLPERFLTRVRRQTFGFIFQQFHLLRDLTVLENVLLPLYPEPLDFAAMRERGEALLARMDLAGKARFRVRQLSGGEQQRVAIARALVNDPAVVIADEPTAHLDHRLAEEFLAIMGELQHQGKTILLASHDRLVYEHPLVQRVVTMRDGQIVDSVPA